MQLAGCLQLWLTPNSDDCFCHQCSYIGTNPWCRCLAKAGPHSFGTIFPNTPSLRPVLLGWQRKTAETPVWAPIIKLSYAGLSLALTRLSPKMTLALGLEIPLLADSPGTGATKRWGHVAPEGWGWLKRPLNVAKAESYKMGCHYQCYSLSVVTVLF